MNSLALDNDFLAVGSDAVGNHHFSDDPVDDGGISVHVVRQIGPVSRPVHQKDSGMKSGIDLVRKMNIGIQTVVVDTVRSPPGMIAEDLVIEVQIFGMGDIERFCAIPGTMVFPPVIASRHLFRRCAFFRARFLDFEMVDPVVRIPERHAGHELLLVGLEEDVVCPARRGNEHAGRISVGHRFDDDVRTLFRAESGTGFLVLPGVVSERHIADLLALLEGNIADVVKRAFDFWNLMPEGQQEITVMVDDVRFSCLQVMPDRHVFRMMNSGQSPGILSGKLPEVADGQMRNALERNALRLPEVLRQNNPGSPDQKEKQKEIQRGKSFRHIPVLFNPEPGSS